MAREKGWGPEDTAQAAIVKALRTVLPRTAIVLHIPNGGRLTEWSKMRIYGHLGGVRGAPDLMILWDGGVGFMEVKAPGKYPNPDQRAFANKLTAINVPWACVRSIDDALAAAAAWGIPVTLTKPKGSKGVVIEVEAL
jgi:hypothetical protein